MRSELPRVRHSLLLLREQISPVPQRHFSHRWPRSLRLPRQCAVPVAGEKGSRIDRYRAPADLQCKLNIQRRLAGQDRQIVRGCGGFNERDRANFYRTRANVASGARAYGTNGLLTIAKRQHLIVNGDRIKRGQ